MKKILPLLILVVFSLSCSLMDLTSSVAVPTSTLEIAFTPTPEETSQEQVTEGISPLIDDNLLFSDDFSNEESGWSITSDEDSKFFYSNGEYFIQVFHPTYSYTSRLDKTFPAGVLSIEARQTTGGEVDSGPVIYWRFKNFDNYYAIMIDDSGSFMIYRLVNGNYELISLPKPFPALNPSGRNNKVTIAFYDDQNDIYLNDQFAIHFTDSKGLVGGIGLGISPSETHNVEVAFDNLNVFAYQPDLPSTPQRPPLTPTPTYNAISWMELVDFLKRDHTNWNEYEPDTYNCLDFAIDLVANARAQNIQAHIVGVDLVGQETGHAFVEFITSDRGPIYVEPQGDNTYSHIEIGQPLCDDWGKFECMGIIESIRYTGDCDHRHYCAVEEP